jgi:sulfate permease, SulP family
MIAIVEAYRAGLLGKAHWLPNLVSGIIVAVVAVPLAMAFAIASGAKPEQGLYTAIVAGLIVSIFGGSRLQIAGPTGAFIVLLSDIVSRHGVDGLQTATLLAGLILAVLGIARFGAIIKFIPDPVIVGFTSGIAVVIWIGQWKDFFGIHPAPTSHFHGKVYELLRVLPSLDGATTLIGVVSLGVLILWQKKSPLKRLPGPLVVLVGATIIQVVFGFKGVATIGSAFGGIPNALPSFSIPSLSLDKISVLIGPAFTIAMLGAIESLLSAVVADSMAGTRHDSNQELIAQGLANIAAPLFGGFAATGAIARTATGIRNGSTSPLAGITHACVLILVIVIFAPLASSIPLCTLAAILFVVAWNMSEAHHFFHLLKRAPRADSAILLLTFFLTVFADLVVAVNIGVVVATLHFMKRMAASVEVRQSVDEELKEELKDYGPYTLPPHIAVYVVEGPFFFGAIETFERALASMKGEIRTVIVRLKWVPFMDGTALLTLEKTVDLLKKRGVKVILSGANHKVKYALDRAALTDKIGSEFIFQSFPEAVQAVSSKG